MAAVLSTEKKIKRLNEQIKKYKDNPKIFKKLSDKLRTISPKKKK
jgi:hypothetical protein